MADEYLMDLDFSVLDLNQEPSNPTLHRVERYGSLLNELETGHDMIEGRIRQLEGVTARTRLRHQFQRTRISTERTSFPSKTMVDVGQRGTHNFKSSERGKGCKRDSSHLVAKALEEMGSEIKKPDKEGGSFYDCNICLEVAKEPILTICGHLFCWSCFYRVSGIDSASECPVCKGEVSDGTVIPIYCNGNSERVFEMESGLMMPPRPKARRVESVRQHRVTQGPSHVPIAEALSRIRISIGAIDNQTQQEGGTVSQAGQSDRLRIHQVSRVLSESAAPHQVSRVLSESAAPLSSMSSALSNAERLVEDLEAVINNMLLRNDAQAIIRPNRQSPVSNVYTNVILPITSLQSTDVATSVLRTRFSSYEGLPLAPFSSSFRRQTLISRTLNWNGRDPRELRRRRLN